MRHDTNSVWLRSVRFVFGSGHVWSRSVKVCSVSLYAASVGVVIDIFKVPTHR